MSVPSPRFYVYVLCRPAKGKVQERPFYVGKGQGYRVDDHEREARLGHDCYKCRVIRKVWREGEQITKYIVFTTDDEQEAYTHEAATIAMYGVKTLVNHNEGGEGGSSPTPEIRAKISAARKAQFASPEARAMLSARAKAQFSTPEGRERQRANANAMWAKPEVRAKFVVAAKARRASKERRAQQRAQMKTLLESPEFRAMLRAPRKPLSPETRAKISARAKERLASPEERAKISTRMKANWIRRKANS